MRVALISTKGGTGKTTSSVYLASALHRLGRTLLVDSDPQLSALTWSQQNGGLPFTVVSLPTRDVHKRLVDLAADYEHVVLDSPPGDLGIIRSVVLAAEVGIVPVAPTGLDLNRLRPTFELLAELEPVNPVEVGVLLTRVRKGTRSIREAKEVLDEFGYPVLDTQIPLAEMYAGSFGSAPAELGQYEDLLVELRS